MTYHSDQFQAYAGAATVGRGFVHRAIIKPAGVQEIKSFAASSSAERKG